MSFDIDRMQYLGGYKKPPGECGPAAVVMGEPTLNERIRFGYLYYTLVEIDAQSHILYWKRDAVQPLLERFAAEYGEE